MSGDGIIGTMPGTARNGLPEFVPYRYQGTGADTLTAFMDERPRKRKRKRKPAPCGTYAGYRRHLSRKEVPCDACMQACRAYRRGYSATRKRGEAAAARARLEEATAECLDRYRRAS